MINELADINRRLDDLTERINELLRRVGGTAPPVTEVINYPAQPELPIAHPPGWLPTSSGRYMPAPVPTDGSLMGYIARVAPLVGKAEQYQRTVGALFLGTDNLVPRSVPYPDGYAAYKMDPANWPDMAEKFFWPPAQTPDPGWDALYRSR